MTLSIRPDSTTFDIRAGATQHGGITALFLGCQVNPYSSGSLLDDTNLF